MPAVPPGPATVLGYLILVPLWAFHLQSLQLLHPAAVQGAALLSGIAVWTTVGALLRRSLVPPWAAVMGLLFAQGAQTGFLLEPASPVPWGRTREQVLLALHLCTLVTGLVHLVRSPLVYPVLRWILIGMGGAGLWAAGRAMSLDQGLQELLDGAGPTWAGIDPTFLAVNGFFVSILCLCFFELVFRLLRGEVGEGAVLLFVVALLFALLRLELDRYEAIGQPSLRTLLHDLGGLAPP